MRQPDGALFEYSSLFNVFDDDDGGDENVELEPEPTVAQSGEPAAEQVNENPNIPASFVDDGYSSKLNLNN